MAVFNIPSHKKRAIRGTRTLALLITSELLYHLSHIGMR